MTEQGTAAKPAEAKPPVTYEPLDACSRASRLTSFSDVKGKGKAVEEPKKADPKPYDVEEMDDDDDEDDDMEEAEEEDDVSPALPELPLTRFRMRRKKRVARLRPRGVLTCLDMAEIDPSNIVGRRTRGKKIDYAKEAQAAGNELEDDEEDDEDFVRFPRPSFNQIANSLIG
jgi:hypothetical protein